MRSERVTKRKAMAIAKRHKVDVPPPGEERLLATGAKLVTSTDKRPKYRVCGYMFDGSDMAV